MGVRYFDAALNLRAALGGPLAANEVRRIYLTHHYVYTSLSADHAPVWLRQAVMERVEDALLAGDFPLCPDTLPLSLWPQPDMS